MLGRSAFWAKHCARCLTRAISFDLRHNPARPSDSQDSGRGRTSPELWAAASWEPRVGKGSSLVPITTLRRAGGFVFVPPHNPTGTDGLPASHTKKMRFREVNQPV